MGTSCCVKIRVMSAPVSPSESAQQILPPGRYPAISRSKNFRTVGYEKDEVVLAPGKYIINKNKTKSNNFIERFGFRSYLHVKYIPSNKLKYHNYKFKG